MKASIDEIREALQKTQGNLSNAAKLLGCSRVTLSNWAKQSRVVRTAIKESRKQLLDRCITSAQALALGVPITDEDGKFIGWKEKPDAGMLKYFITTLGRDEGFGENLDITTNGKDIGNVKVEIIDTKEQVKQKPENDESSDDDDNEEGDDLDE